MFFTVSNLVRDLLAQVSPYLEAPLMQACLPQVWVFHLQTKQELVSRYMEQR